LSALVESLAPTAATDGAAGTDALAGLRVLFLPKNSRPDFFQSFLRTAHQVHGWQIQVVCVPAAEVGWRTIIGQGGGTVAVPDFNPAADWEKDAAATRDIDDFIAACELATGISAGRILLAGERELGRGFSSSVFHWFHTRTARMVLADNTEPARIMRRMFAFARATLLTHKPDLLLAGEWADPICFTFYMAARQLGIRCAVNRPSKVWSGRGYWSAEPMMYNHAARALVTHKRSENASVSARARERIAEFRSAPATLGYVQKNWEASDRRGFFGYHLDLARLLGVEIRYYLGGRSGPPPKPALRLAFDHYRRAWLKLGQARLFRRFDEAALRDMRYLFIALHKDPEQGLNYQAPYWSYQIYTVGLLSSCLPYGYRLLVREHRNNFGRRPWRFYKHMRSLPGVQLIDGFDSQFKYIANADLVVTDNGSTGWEGLLLRRPVITLADNFYDSIELAHRVPDPEQLATAVVRLLDQPSGGDAAAYDRALGWLLDAEWETTAPLDAPDDARTRALLADVYSGKDSSPPSAPGLPPA